MFLSKMTAAVLDDLKYIVDASAVSFEAGYSEFAGAYECAQRCVSHTRYQRTTVQIVPD